jgi:hypothetical protein
MASQTTHDPRGLSQLAAAPIPLPKPRGSLSAREAVEHYVAMRDICEPEQWTASWLPITHEGWYQTAIELDTGA